MDDTQRRQVIEALIFASNQPVSKAAIKKILDTGSDRDIEQAVQTLNSMYHEAGLSFEVVEVGGGYRFMTRSQFVPWIRKLFHGRRKPRLTRAAMETLAIIAYRQPIHRSAVEAIRGVNIDGVLHTLLERRLITITGRAKGPGRPLLYATTQEFLQYFGINDLTDLPEIREIEDILNKVEPLQTDAENDKEDDDGTVIEAAESMETADTDDQPVMQQGKETIGGDDNQNTAESAPVPHEDIPDRQSGSMKPTNAAE